MPTSALWRRRKNGHRADVGIGSYGRAVMKKMKLSAIMVPLAAAGFVLRWLVYRTAVDEKNLIVAGHPALIALWALTAAALALAAFGGWTRENRPPFRTAHGPAFLGHGLLGVAMAVAAVLGVVPMPGILGTVWKLLGLSGGICLLAAGFSRLRGKVPFFLLYGVPSLFFTVHVVAHYQLWCSNPQFTDYAFGLLASVMLALRCYQLSAFGADAGSRKMLAFTGLAAVYLCGAEMAASLYPYLYFAGALFCLTDLKE